MGNKFEIPFDNIIGANPQQKEKVKEDWQSDSVEFAERDEIKYAELEQVITPEKRNEILKIEKYVNEIAGFYGATEKLEPKIVMLEAGGVFKFTEGEFREGFCYEYSRRIVVDSKESRVGFATTLAHELFHLAGFNSLRYSKETGDTKLYRTGIALISKDGKDIYFHDIAEALVAEASRIFFERYLRNDPQYVEEIKKTDFVKGWLQKYYNWCNVPIEKQNEILDDIYLFPDIDHLIDKLNGDDVEDFKFGFLHGYIEGMLEDDAVILRERSDERKKFYSLVDEILKNSEGRYSDRQEIVDVFMRAQFSGRLLPLARILEKTIDKGSFRRAANDFAKHIKKEENNQ